MPASVRPDAAGSFASLFPLPPYPLHFFFPQRRLPPEHSCFFSFLFFSSQDLPLLQAPQDDLSSLLFSRRPSLKADPHRRFSFPPPFSLGLSLFFSLRSRRARRCTGLFGTLSLFLLFLSCLFFLLPCSIRQSRVFPSSFLPQSSFPFLVIPYPYLLPHLPFIPLTSPFLRFPFYHLPSFLHARHCLLPFDPPLFFLTFCFFPFPASTLEIRMTRVFCAHVPILGKVQLPLLDIFSTLYFPLEHKEFSAFCLPEDPRPPSYIFHVY